MFFGYMPLFDVSKTPSEKAERKLSRETVENMVLAADIIQETLETIPEEWAAEYSAGYRRLIALIEKNKNILDEPKKELDITRSL